MIQFDPSHTRAKSGETILIRAGLPDDAGSLLAITAAVIEEGEFVVTVPGEFDLTEEQERDWILLHDGDPRRVVIVAEHKTEVIGFLHFHCGHRQRLAHRGRLHMLVAKPWRSKGVGLALLRSLLKWAGHNELVEKVCLAVFSNNEGAIALYRKCGFLEEGRRLREIRVGPDHYVDEILMYRFVDGS